MNRPGREFKKRQTTKNTKEICKRYNEGENFEKIQGESLYHTFQTDYPRARGRVAAAGLKRARALGTRLSLATIGTAGKPLIGYLFRGYFYYPLTCPQRLNNA